MARFNALQMEQLRELISDNSDLSANEITKLWNSKHPETVLTVGKVYQTISRDRQKDDAAVEKKPRAEKSAKKVVETNEYTFYGLMRKIEEVEEYAKKLQAQQAEKVRTIFLA